MEWKFIFGSAYVLLACFLIYILNSKRKRIRPSLNGVNIIKGIPILGILPSVKPPLYRYLTTLSDIYGCIFRIKLGLREIIVVNDFVTVKTIFNNHNNNNNRPNGWVSGLSQLEDERLITLSKEGKKITQKDFITRILEDFLSQDSRLNEIVQVECRHFLEGIGKEKREFSDFSNFISFHFFNIISKLLMNKRFSNWDSKYQVFKSDLSVGTKQRKLVSLLYMMFPVLDQLRVVSKYIVRHFSKMKIYEDLRSIFEEEIRHRSTGTTLKLEPNDLIDQLVITRRQLENNHVGYTDINAPLLLNIFQFVTSELEVISQIVERSLILMIKYPNIQKDVHNEIVRVVGKGRMASLDDRRFLHYTQAVMDEILRVSSSILMETFYTTPNGTTVDSLYIPSDELIVVNAHSCNTDPEVWERPYDFYPDHFLTKIHDNKPEYCPREELVFYALDKRHFFQESLAKKEYFIFFTNILQKFQIGCNGNLYDQPYQKSEKNEFSTIKNFIFKSYDNLSE